MALHNQGSLSPTGHPKGGTTQGKIPHLLMPCQTLKNATVHGILFRVLINHLAARLACIQYSVNESATVAKKKTPALCYLLFYISHPLNKNCKKGFGSLWFRHKIQLHRQTGLERVAQVLERTKYTHNRSHGYSKSRGTPPEFMEV